MTKDNIVLPYKLEQHLTEICKENLFWHGL